MFADYLGRIMEFFEVREWQDSISAVGSMLLELLRHLREFVRKGVDHKLQPIGDPEL